jgi:hypothetical protein
MLEGIFFIKEDFMRKIHHISISALVALGLALTACPGEEEIPSSRSNNNTGKETPDWTIYTLPAPAFVSATAYGPTGTIRVSWEPVDGATGYDVFRKSEGPDGTTVKVMYTGSGYPGIPEGTVPGTEAPTDDTYVGFVDVTGENNQFKAGVNYTYRVVANLDTPDTLGGTAINGIWVPTLNDDTWIRVEKGSTESNTVSFPTSGANRLLGRGEKLAPPANLKLVRGDYYHENATPSETVYALWDAQYGVTYHVFYTLPGADGIGITKLMQPVTASDAKNLEQITLLSSLPNIYTDIKVEVIAAKSGVTATGETPYYLSSSPVTATLTAGTPSVAAPLWDTFTPITQITGTDTVRLTITKRPEFASYRVYRFIGSATGYTVSGFEATGGGYVYESWKEITGEVRFTDLDADTLYIDDLSALDNKYPGAGRTNPATLFYTVVGVDAAGKISKPAAIQSWANAAPYETPILSKHNLGWNWAMGGYRGVHLGWTPRAGESYKVKRVAADYQWLGGDISETANWLYLGLTDSEWRDVTPPDINVAVDGSHGFIDTPAIRKSYHYKLEAYDTLTNALKGSSAIRAEYSYPYHNVMPDALAPSVSVAGNYSGIVLPPSERFKAYKTAVTISVPFGSTFTEFKAWLNQDESIKIYRAPVEAVLTPVSEKGPYVLAKTISYNEMNTIRFIDTDVPGPGSYKYVAEIVNGGNIPVQVYSPYADGVNTSIGNSTSSTVSPTETSSITNGLRRIERNPDGGNSGFRVTEVLDTNVLDGTKLIVRTFSVGTGNDWDYLTANPRLIEWTSTELTLSLVTPIPGTNVAGYTTGTVPTPGNFGRIEVYYVLGNGELNSATPIATFDWAP